MKTHNSRPKNPTQMIDVGSKPVSARCATASGKIVVGKATLKKIVAGRLDKGDALEVARIAGIMAAKRTDLLLPLCHPLPIDQITLDFTADENENALTITATVRASAKTGVEMEALTAVTVAALTIYDMCKSVERSARIEAVRLISKSGGTSGDYLEPAHSHGPQPSDIR